MFVTFYSDSTNDLPLLERADAPAATNPIPALRNIASARGWRIWESVHPFTMIKKFIDKPLGKKTAGTPSHPDFGKRRDVPVSEHHIDPAPADDAPAAWCTRSNRRLRGYIVGGAARDPPVGLRPKDFDAATNATPEQVKSLFRRAFIIGPRFRIVHVVFGRGREHEVIEVSTFRAYLDNTAAGQVAGNERTSRNELAGMTHAVDASGPGAARQRVRVAGAGRGAARFHSHQCDVLRPRDADRGRLPRRHQGFDRSGSCA